MFVYAHIHMLYVRIYTYTYIFLLMTRCRIYSSLQHGLNRQRWCDFYVHVDASCRSWQRESFEATCSCSYSFLPSLSIAIHKPLSHWPCQSQSHAQPLSLHARTLTRFSWGMAAEYLGQRAGAGAGAGIEAGADFIDLGQWTWPDWLWSQRCSIASRCPARWASRMHCILMKIYGTAALAVESERKNGKCVSAAVPRCQRLVSSRVGQLASLATVLGQLLAEARAAHFARGHGQRRRQGSYELGVGV